MSWRLRGELQVQRYYFFNTGARWGGWLTPRPGSFTPRKRPGTLCTEAPWALRQIWTSAENIALTGIRSPDLPARTRLLDRLSYPGPRYRHSCLNMGHSAGTRAEPCCLIWRKSDKRLGWEETSFCARTISRVRATFTSNIYWFTLGRKRASFFFWGGGGEV